MKSLGRIYLFSIFLISSLYGAVTASVDPQSVTIGDVVTYTLKVDGSAEKAPAIYQICGQDIIQSGSSRNIVMNGTDYKSVQTYYYQFVAKKSCTIEPVSVVINGKLEKSNSVELHVNQVSGNTGQDFLLEYHVSKTNLYVGESLRLTLLLKQKQSASVVDSKFLPSDFQGFWKKSESKPQRSKDGEYMITKVEYLLSPQREGNVTISPAELRVASRVSSRGWSPTFMPQVRWKSYFSNELALQVKALPNNASLIGDFTIEADVDKTTVNPNEAVNVTIKVKGDGNLEDMESFKPYIDGVNVFDEKSELHGNTLTQKLVFVGGKDFTIPPFEITFFDTATKQLKKIQTKPIEIKVKGSIQKPKENLTIKKETIAQEVAPVETSNVDKNNPFIIIIALLSGVFIGVIGMVLKGKIVHGNKLQKFSLKDEKLLLVKLLPYKDSDDEVKKIVEILEKNLYTANKEQIDKAKLKEIVKKYSLT